jgi:hypothetical protein
MDHCARSNKHFGNRMRRGLDQDEAFEKMGI